MKIYTRAGDEGATALFGGGKVGKDHPRVEAYGDVDELNASLGLARSIDMMPRIDEVLVPVQRDLFAIGALLATPDHVKMKEQLSKARIDEQRIEELKHDLSAGGFCVGEFFGTEAAFLSVLFAFNLLGPYQRQLDPARPYRQPATLRSQVFVAGAILGLAGKQVALKLSQA